MATRCYNQMLERSNSKGGKAFLATTPAVSVCHSWAGVAGRAAPITGPGSREKTHMHWRPLPFIPPGGPVHVTVLPRLRTGLPASLPLWRNALRHTRRCVVTITQVFLKPPKLTRLTLAVTNMPGPHAEWQHWTKGRFTF